MNKILYIILVLSFSLVCCKKDPTTGMVDIAVTPYFGDSVLSFDTKYPFVVNGVTYKFKVDLLKFYIHDLKITNASDSVYQFSDLSLFNFKDIKTIHFVDTIPVGLYHKFNFGIGMTDVQNNTNPNSVEASHPLSTYNAMYWGMLKYRYLVMEAVIYDANGVELAQGVSFHINTLKTKSSDIHLEVLGDMTSNITLKLDVEKIFTTTGKMINPSVENLTHMNDRTQIDLGNIVTENFVNGSSLIFK
jgi:hypothetical protein